METGNQIFLSSVLVQIQILAVIQCFPSLTNVLLSSFTLKRRIAAGAGISYTVESPTLEANSWTEVEDVVVNVVSTLGDFETVELSNPSGDWQTESERFFRIQVTLNL